MCFHAQQTRSASEVQERFQAQGLVSLGVYNGFSHPKVTAICDQAPQQLQLLQWGIIPHWAKDRSIQKYTLNARQETLHQKPSFKEAKRGLLIADGFFEWQWLDSAGRKKKKYLVTLPNGGLFAFAALWDQWIDPYSGAVIQSAAIVTQAAQGIMRTIHNSKMRMPLILSPEEESLWLVGGTPKPVTDLHATPI